MQLSLPRNYIVILNEKYKIKFAYKSNKSIQWPIPVVLPIRPFGSGRSSAHLSQHIAMRMRYNASPHHHFQWEYQTGRQSVYLPISLQFKMMINLLLYISPYMSVLYVWQEMGRWRWKTYYCVYWWKIKKRTEIFLNALSTTGLSSAPQHWFCCCSRQKHTEYTKI